MLFRPIVAGTLMLFASNLWAGSTPNLVLLDADFNDKALPIGAAFWTHLVQSYLA